MQLFAFKTLVYAYFSLFGNFIASNDLDTSFSFFVFSFFSSSLYLMIPCWFFSLILFLWQKETKFASHYKWNSKLTDWSQESPPASSGEEAQGLFHSSMKNATFDQAVGLPIMSIRYDSGISRDSAAFETSNRKQKADSPIAWMSKFSKRADSYVKGIKDHVNLGPKISETVKGKLSLGAQILQAGGIERVFRQNFSVEEGEKLLHAFQCYLSTTAGPIAGLLFVSTNKIAFRSHRSIRIASPRRSLPRIPYKVLIPIGKVQRTSLCENSDKPNQKYIQIVTVDDFEFWFMGFLCYQRSLKYLRRAISKSQVDVLNESVL